MVDWALAGRLGYRERMLGRGVEMHAAATHALLPPLSDMSHEDDAELNVMDFVETEYKSDCDTEAKQTTKRKRVRSKSKGLRVGKAASRPQGVPVLYDDDSVMYKKKKRKRCQRVAPHGNDSGVALCYPYAAYLKSLCDKVGDAQQSPEPNALSTLSRRLFDRLQRSDVHFPYASLLAELHHHARRDEVPSRVQALGRDPRLWEVAEVMRNLRYPTQALDHPGEVNRADEFATPFSARLMALVMQQKVQGYASQVSGSSKLCDFHGIGEILKNEMPQSQEEDPPPTELYSSSLLQKLSFSAEQELEVTGERTSLPGGGGGQHLPDWSSTESSHSEEDDLDWRPTHWLAKKVSIDATIPTKRKSVRKKQPDGANHSAQVNQVGRPNTSQECPSYATPTVASRRKDIKMEPHLCSSPDSASTLLQLIMSHEQETSEKRSRKARKRSKLSRKKGKRKHVNNNQKHSFHWGGKLHDVGSAQGKVGQAEEEGRGALAGEERGRHRRSRYQEPQSLLKEYLLKPPGEEITPSENCDIPKVETSFLFSRLLQNFKSLAESSQCEEVSERGPESCTGPSILRGMLAAGNVTDTTLERHHRGEEPRDRMSTSPLLTNAQFTVKSEQEIKVECEEIICKIECEEDGFECQVCHLQFSSSIDLSNHQILFHCTEDPQGSSGHLACSVDGLQGATGVLQEKQPA